MFGIKLPDVDSLTTTPFLHEQVFFCWGMFGCNDVQGLFYGVLQEFFFEPVKRESNPKKERHFLWSFSSV